MRVREAPVLPANAAVVFVGLLDLLTTLIWLDSRHAVEVNPIMAAVLASGIGLFAAVKLSTLLAYVAVVEYYRRRHNARLAVIVARFTLAAYILIYAVSFTCVNHRMLLG